MDRWKWDRYQTVYRRVALWKDVVRNVELWLWYGTTHELGRFYPSCLFYNRIWHRVDYGGIFTFLENSIGHYTPQIIQAFRAINDDNDADILAEICTLCPPEIMRSEFLAGSHQEYEITCFNANHELKEEIADRIVELSRKLYLNTDFGNCCLAL